jgi:phage N-6-adenine-methyltransferase
MAGSVDWQTPPLLFNALHYTCNFKVDAAASGENHLVEDWYGPGSPLGEDALAVEKWLSPAWCNPPYGKGIERWLDKFIEESTIHHGKVVALLPARVETRWWYEKVVPWCDIIFLVGRVPFLLPGREKPSQPDHASALCIYEPTSSGKVSWIDWKAKLGDPDANQAE